MLQIPPAGRTLLLSLLLAGCTGSAEAPVDSHTEASVETVPETPAGASVEIEGAVVAVDLAPWAYDGNARVDVRTDAGDTEAVSVPARTNLCKARGLGLVGDVQPGDRVAVRGERSDEGTLTPCAEADHEIRIVRRSASGTGVYRGVFESGFETSAFHPCDRPDESWWVRADGDFGDRFDAIRRRHSTQIGRGQRLFVEATVVGTLETDGGYGHLSQYAAQLDVTETRDMVFLAENPDTDPGCR